VEKLASDSSRPGLEVGEVGRERGERAQTAAAGEDPEQRGLLQFGPTG
jgi:hypothetical protein